MTATSNPLLVESSLPFQAPPFDTITSRDFAPAFDVAIEEHAAEIERIASNPAPPSFDNVLVALERSGRTLARVSHAFSVLSGTNTNDTLQRLLEEVTPKLAAHQDSIYLNARLFTRLEAVYNARASITLDPESARLLEHQYKEFVMAGARLSDDRQAALKALNQEEAALGAKFTNQLLAATNAGALVVDDVSALAGLSAAEIDAAREHAREHGLEGKWRLALSNTTQQPLLSSLSNRATRERLFKASWLRAQRDDANDTRAIIARIAEIRAAKAKLLGHSSFASWRLQDQMAARLDTVEAFIGQLVPAATARARSEAAAIQTMVNAQCGGFTVEPWDWDYYAEQVRKAKFDIDPEQARPYFELNRVLADGVFFAAQELFGITFAERHDLPVYQPDVRVFEVFDHDGTHLALFYADLLKRDNKNGGAWMDNMVTQAKLFGTRPVIFNVSNFAKPAAGQPALISFSDVTTMFHEFGHALHGIFADQQYPTLSGTAVARDFVEFPSQINEHWALDPKVLANYAKHYQTGEPMPQELVDKITQAAKFNQGYAMTELLAATSLDIAWHTRAADATTADVDAFESAALTAAKLNLSLIPPRYRSSYFLHIWGNGYAAGYYAYLWAQMLDDDAYAWFVERGGLTRENGQRLRDMVLSRGNTQDYQAMYRAFRGRDAKIDAMLVHRGLVPEPNVDATTEPVTI